MPIDPNISLQVGQGGFGPDWRTIITMQELGQRMQMQQEEQKGLNALRTLYGNQQNVDQQSGLLTPQARNQLMQQAPLMGLQYNQNALQMQERQARSAVEGARLNEYVRSDASRMRNEALAAYDQAMSNGLSPDAARQRVQDDIYTPWYQQTMKSGLVSPEQVRQIHPDFDPMRARQNKQAEDIATAKPLTPLQLREEQRKDVELGIKQSAEERGQTKLGLDVAKTTRGDFTEPKNVEVRRSDGTTYQTMGVYDKAGRRWMSSDATQPLDVVRETGTGAEAEKLAPSKEIAVVDKDGNVVERFAAREKPAGGFVHSDDPTKPVVVPEGGRIDVGQAAGAVIGSRENVYIGRILEGGITATTDLENISKMPVGVTSGIFGGRRQGPGLMDATKEVLANKLTSQDVQIYNSANTGIQRALAVIESAGLAPSGAFTEQFQGLTLKEGDSQLTRLYKMANARQVVENGMQVIKANPRVAPEQKHLADQFLDRVREAIPWTTADVIKLQTTDKPGATLHNLGVTRAQGKASGVAPSGSPAPATSQELPSSAAAQLKEGQVTHFQNGQSWTLRNGQPERVQ